MHFNFREHLNLV